MYWDGSDKLRREMRQQVGTFTLADGRKAKIIGVHPTRNDYLLQFEDTGEKRYWHITGIRSGDDDIA